MAKLDGLSMLEFDPLFHAPPPTPNQDTSSVISWDDPLISTSWDNPIVSASFDRHQIANDTTIVSPQIDSRSRIRYTTVVSPLDHHRRARSESPTRPKPATGTLLSCRTTRLPSRRDRPISPYQRPIRAPRILVEPCGNTSPERPCGSPVHHRPTSTCRMPSPPRPAHATELLVDPPGVSSPLPRLGPSASRQVSSRQPLFAVDQSTLRESINRLLPKSFSGASDPNVSPVDFVRAIETLVKDFNLDISQLLPLLSATLTGPAARWWRLTSHRFTNTGLLLQSFRNQFVSRTYLDAIQFKIQTSRQQVNESAVKFVDRVVELYDKLPYDELDHIIIRQITFGLLPSYSLHIGSRPFNSILELRAEAERLDMYFCMPTSSRDPPRRPINCFNCGKHGHKSNECRSRDRPSAEHSRRQGNGHRGGPRQRN